MAIVPRIYIDPYGPNTFKPSNSKSLFKEQHLHSNVLNSYNVNQLSNIFNNDSVIDGLDLTNIYLTNNNRTINFTLSKGRLIQDNTLVDILQDINIKIDVFSQYSINQANISNNYFRVSGNQVLNFYPGKQFAIFNSTNSAYNHKNWIANYSELDGNFTRIYTHNNIDVNNTTGQIINHNFQNSPHGTVVIMSKFKYQDTITNNDIIFTPIFITNDLKYYPHFDPNLHRILYGIIYISVDLNIYQIKTTGYHIEDSVMSVFLKGKQYTVKNLTLSGFDGGILVN